MNLILISRFRIANIILVLLVICNWNVVNAQSKYVLTHFDDEHGLASNQINNLVLDNDNVLWFVSGNQITSFDGRNFKLSPTAEMSNVYGSKYIYMNLDRELAYSDSKMHYLKAEDADFFSIDSNKSKFGFTKNIPWDMFLNFREKLGYDEPAYRLEYLKHHQLEAVTFDENGLYYKSIHGIKRFNEINTKEFPHILSLKNDTTIVIYSDRILKFYEGNLLTQSMLMIRNSKSFSNLFVHRIFNIRGHFYLCSDNSLYAMNLSENKIFLECIIDETQYPKDDVISLEMNENSQTIFLGTATSGLYIYSKAIFHGHENTVNHFHSFNSIMPMKDGLYTNNAVKWNYDVTLSKKGLNAFRVYGADYVNELNGNRYFTSDSLLVKIDDGLLAKNYTLDDELFYTTSFNYHNKLYVWNRSYFATISNNVIAKLDYDYQNKGLLTVHSILIHHDSLWVGSTHGLSLFKLGKRTRIMKDTFTEYAIRSIQLDPQNRGILIFTYGDGVFLYKEGRFYKGPVDDNEHLNFVHYMFLDTLNRVWLPTNNGIYCTNYENWFSSFTNKTVTHPYFVHFTKLNGLLTNEMNGGTAHSHYYDTSTGRLYISTVNGLHYFQPNKVKLILPNNPILIADLIVDDSIKASLSNLPSYFNSIKFTFRSAYYGNAENLKIEYSISPLSDVWHPLNNLGEFYFIRRSPGNQTVYVRYRNGFGSNDYKIQKFDFFINPYWYERKSIQGAIVLLILGVFWFILWLRGQRQKRKQIELVKIIDERTKELKNTLDELTISEENLRNSDKMKEKVIRVLAHDIRSPLMSTIYLSNHIHEQFKQTSELDRKEGAEMMNEIVQALGNMLEYSNDFLAWYNMHQENLKPNLYNTNIDEILEKVLKLYRPIIKGNGNTLKVYSSENYLCYTDPKLLTIIIRNLVDNANKYTNENQIDIKISKASGAILFSISNQASHMNQAKKQKLLEMFAADQNDVDLSDLKFGLNLVLYLAMRIYIQYKIHIDENGFITIELYIPVNN